MTDFKEYLSNNIKKWYYLRDNNLLNFRKIFIIYDIFKKYKDITQTQFNHIIYSTNLMEKFYEYNTKFITNEDNKEDYYNTFKILIKFCDVIEAKEDEELNDFQNIYDYQIELNKIDFIGITEIDKKYYIYIKQIINILYITLQYINNIINNIINEYHNENLLIIYKTIKKDIINILKTYIYYKGLIIEILKENLKENLKE